MNDWNQAENILKKGGVIVAPTDTLYGILARAEDKKAVERVYKIKGRNTKKPFIILINSEKDLEKFVIKHSDILKNVGMFVGKKVSFILNCESKKFEYLHRGNKSLAFRIISPRNRNLYKLIKNVGPLVAPSANPEGLKPAKSILEAKKYFNKQIDLYINGGNRNAKPSTIISLLGEKIEILRK